MTKRLSWRIGVIGLASLACDSPGDRAGTLDETAQASDATGAGDGAPRSDVGLDAGDEPVCERWRGERASLIEGRWTGTVSGCEAGRFEAPGPDNTLRQVNFYRSLAGLPAVALDADKSEQAQACALLMHANQAIEHEVPSDWTCWSAAGSAAAGLSNLATTPGVASISLYMTDQDVDNLGHRRWLLSNSLGPIGVGSTSEFSCLHVLSGEGDARARWVAWPPAGDVPIQALHVASWADVDLAGWSVQSDYVDLTRGAVTVMRDGASMPVDVWPLAAGYGSTFGLGIRPRGWRTTAGATYDVAVAGLSEPIGWRFTVVDCR